MGFSFLYILQNLWPLSLFKYSDLRASDELVSKLPIPENTKRFVFAVRDTESESVIYLLSAQSLSERSAFDAECLIKAVRPQAVVAQVGHSAVSEVQLEESEFGGGRDELVPTSPFGVVKRCFLDKIDKEKYENVAGNLVLKEIFGVGFHGHILAAKKAAKEVGSSFLMLETPFVKTFVEDGASDEVDVGSTVQGFVSSLVPRRMGSVVVSSSRRFHVTDDVQLWMVKLLSSFMDSPPPKLIRANSAVIEGVKEIQPVSNYQGPAFAQSIYPLLLDLYNIFVDLPSIGRALAFSQKMLHDVSRGESVDTQMISEVFTFRIAVEGLRIALNNAGRLPIQNDAKVKFSDLKVDDKSYALLVQALKSQMGRFQTIVAVVDASSLGGLRKHWTTPVPLEVKDLIGHLLTCCDSDGKISNQSEKKWMFPNKPVVAVGAGATAVLGASSLSKLVPASTLMKIVSFKLPVSLKLLLSQTQKILSIVLSKSLGPSKLVAPGLANAGANTSLFKAVASAEKIRTVTHSVIASVEKTSISAMRTAFYEIMRKRRAQSVGVLPWATFGCSIATCSAFLMYADGIEYAAESIPVAPSIASLGRGIQGLRQASLEVGQTDATRIQKAIESLMYRLRRVKIQ